MSKITITLDATKLRGLVSKRQYDAKDGQKMEVQEVKFELVPVKEPKIIYEGTGYKLQKSHFASVIQTKEEWILSETPTANCKSIKTELGEYIGMLSLNVVRPALMSEQKKINEANAKLIACAPEMLDMLKFVTLNLPMISNKELINEIEELITKATT